MGEVIPGIDAKEKKEQRESDDEYYIENTAQAFALKAIEHLIERDPDGRLVEWTDEEEKDLIIQVVANEKEYKEKYGDEEWYKYVYGKAGYYGLNQRKSENSNLAFPEPWKLYKPKGFDSKEVEFINAIRKDLDRVSEKMEKWTGLRVDIIDDVGLAVYKPAK